MSGPGTTQMHEAPRSTRGDLVAFVCLFALMFAYSLIQANIPGVNEPHYLTKARHVWDPSWCAGDLFLESSNPHLVFYRTVGALAAVTYFPVAAVLGRLLGSGLVAYGWQRLSRTVTGSRWAGFVSAAFALSLATFGNWSGEWLVGGVESKVFAYGFAYWATAVLLEGRVTAAGLLAGLSVSFHPVVGVWFTATLAAAALAHCTAWCPIRGLAGLKTRVWLLGGLTFLVAAAPGVVPALAVLGAGSEEAALEATRYQVTRRLAHHLNPFAFAGHAHLAAAIAVALWGGLTWAVVTRRLGGRLSGDARHSVIAVQVMVAASILIAAGGVLVAAGLPSDWAVKLLKFYPFRVADILVPWSLCLMTATILVTGTPLIAARLATAAAILVALGVPAHDRDSSRLSPSMKEDWGNVCWWVRSNTPEDALCLAAETRWAFKWFAQRPEYVNHKDCPQDPESIAEFRRRQRVLYDWSTAAIEDQLVTADELSDLREQTGIDYLITYRFGPIEPPPTHSGGYFHVYRLAP